MADLKSQFEPSAPNRLRFALMGSTALLSTIAGFALFRDGELFPLPQLLALIGSIVAVQNAQALLCRPYLRLTREGISLRAWPAGTGASLFPLRRFVTLEIPWDCLNGVEAHTVRIGKVQMFSKLIIGYVDAQGCDAELIVPGDVFAKSPTRIRAAILREHDLSLHFTAMDAISKSRRVHPMPALELVEAGPTENRHRRAARELVVCEN